jgi:glutathione synthase/RimK-type ligase-like ATP-grasp enzyme
LILILTNGDDATADWVCRALAKRAYLRLDTDRLPQSAVLRGNGRKVELKANGRWHRPDDFTGVWYRRPKGIRFPGRAPAGEKQHAAEEYTAVLEAFLVMIPESRWINAPARNALAGHKLEQLKRAAALGFQVPKTLVTQDPAEVRRFWRSCGGDMILKPLSHGQVEHSRRHELIYTSAFRKDDLKRAILIRRCPTLFQERIAKSTDIRVTVVDDDIQAAELLAADAGSQRLDIRRNNMTDVKHKPFTLPPALSRRLRRLLTSYGLRFGAVDFVCDSTGRWFFLEINPNGQWAWLDLAGVTDSRRALIKSLQRTPK